MEEHVNEAARQELTRYLTQHNLRKTQERYAMLDAIFGTKGHFTAEDFYEHMERNFMFHVSRATIYNNLEIFMKANLVNKLQLGLTTVYEKVDVSRPHIHLVCTTCGKTVEVRDKSIHESLIAKKVRGFSISHYSVCLYGFCSACARLEKINKKK
ncbi:MAG: transcriptional repressor [Bacteroidales bacterium]|nr:transcriptional repressor [Bacteroidales bacterium]